MRHEKPRSRCLCEQASSTADNFGIGLFNRLQRLVPWADLAYFQSIGNLHRDIYLRTNAIQLEKGELINIFRPVCGLPDAGDIWARMLVNIHLDC